MTCMCRFRRKVSHSRVYDNGFGKFSGHSGHFDSWPEYHPVTVVDNRRFRICAVQNVSVLGNLSGERRVSRAKPTPSPAAAYEVLTR